VDFKNRAKRTDFVMYRHPMDHMISINAGAKQFASCYLTTPLVFAVILAVIRLSMNDRESEVENHLDFANKATEEQVRCLSSN